MATTKHAAVPSLIKAVRIAQYGGSDQLKYEEAPLPEIGPGQVLAKVRYAGVNPIDWKIREGYMKNVRPANFPLTLGQDFAGEIVTGGGDSGHFRTGERVFGFGEGTYAEFTAAAITLHRGDSGENGFRGGRGAADGGTDGPAGNSRLCAAEAGNPDSDPRRGGRVGSFATQIAKRWGAQVIGTASGEDIVYLRSLGHVQVVDYKQERFETVGQVDAVLDLVGGETATRSFAVVKKGGVMVSTVGAANAELAARAGIRGVNMV